MKHAQHKRRTIKYNNFDANLPKFDMITPANNGASIMAVWSRVTNVEFMSAEFDINFLKLKFYISKLELSIFI